MPVRMVPVQASNTGQRTLVCGTRAATRQVGVSPNALVFVNAAQAGYEIPAMPFESKLTLADLGDLLRRFA